MIDCLQDRLFGGIVEGNTEVYLQDNAVVKGMVSGTGINGAKLNERSTSTLYVGTDEQAFTGSVGSIDGFSKVIVTKGSSLKMESGNVFAANEQVITLSAANLKDAALSGSSALVQMRFVPCVQEQMVTRMLTEQDEKDGFYHYLASISSNIGIDQEGNVYDKSAETYPADIVVYDSERSTTPIRGSTDNEGNAIDIVGNLK